MARKKCRLWWPDQLLSCKPNSNLLLFGWYLYSLNSSDIVVAVAVSPNEISHCILQSNLQEILNSVNRIMPMRLQESSAFCLLGHFAANYSNEDLNMMGRQSKDLYLRSNCDSVNQSCHQESSVGAIFGENCGRWKCGCEKLHQFIESDHLSKIRDGSWIQVVSKSQKILSKESRWIPELHHMHLNGHIFSICDVHLITYECPTYNEHHFSLSSWGSTEQVNSPCKKPTWINELNEKPLSLDLVSIVLTLNCACAAKAFLEQQMSTISPVIHFRLVTMLVSKMWHAVALFVASISTIIYVSLQIFYRCLSYGSHTFISVILLNVFRQSWKNVHIRSCQFLYWPIFLQGTGISFHSNIEYAHRAALRKHFMWFNIAMDIFFGIILGVVLLSNAEAVQSCVLIAAQSITDGILRTGCVWLMGVPAGFKLNTELAELLGMISLDAIQIFSTLWFYLHTLLSYFIQGLAVSGIVFGLTVPAAVCIDMLKLATLHVSALHWLICFLYSRQIQALTSLWRLFRGRKWNPLRRRLDSYEYTVEQHVVGSLLFTPILLLLPTTSVFYIFFTMLSNTVTFICIVMEIIISVLHATPYAEIFLWITKRRRFPSGVWFEIISGHALRGDLSSSLEQGEAGHFIGESETLVLHLRSNYATLGQIIAPHYRNILYGVKQSFDTSLAYGVLSGQRIPSAVQTSLPVTMPWMQITFGEYWRLCYRVCSMTAEENYDILTGAEHCRVLFFLPVVFLTCHSLALI